MLKEYNLKSVHLVSLGCSKNLVDSEVILGTLIEKSFNIVQDPKKAQIIIINTCSFIEDAKKESLDAIFEMIDYKKENQGICRILVVAGCLAQRYHHQIEKEIPEVDLIIGTGEYHKIMEYLKRLEKTKLENKSFVDVPNFIHSELDPRVNSSPFYSAWLKVSEGCDRKCTYCIIPQIRGSLRSRTVDSLLIEAQRLVEKGVRELNLISQDLSCYGKDLNNGNNLNKLVSQLEKIENLEWIRLLYLYPDDLTDELIEKIKTSNKVCKYLDIPIQHFSDRILRKMGRQIKGHQIIDRIEKLRSMVPDIVLRTSIIVGFPGETGQDFEKLLAGVRQMEFDHLGVFRYSDEEGTPASRMDDKIDKKIIEDRYNKIYETQKEIIQIVNQKYLNKTIKVLLEGGHPETELLLQGRHMGQAPEIDGNVIINDIGISNGKKINPGDFLEVKITEVCDYDLIGKLLI